VLKHQVKLPVKSNFTLNSGEERPFAGDDAE